MFEINVTIHDQTCHGRQQFRAMRDDGGLIDGRHMIDFDSAEDAELCLRGHFRRTHQPVYIKHHRSPIR